MQNDSPAPIRNLFSALLFSCLLTACGGIFNEPAANGLSSDDGPLSPEVAEETYQQLRKFPNGVEVAIALIEGDSVRYLGVKRVDDSLTYTQNANALFEIGSITKVFTASLLAMEVERGRIKLNDPINPWLPFPIKEERELTFQQLANHTSGLPRIPDFSLKESLSSQNPYADFDSAALAAYLSESVKFEGPAGQQYQYSNTGAGLLAFSLSRITDSSYAEMLAADIFEPLGMDQSTLSHQQAGEALVPGRDEKGKPVPNWTFDVLAGAGAVISSVSDLALFAQAHFDSSAQGLALTRQETYRVDESMALGLGWHILREEADLSWYWHNGGTGGYRSSMAIDVQNRKAVIVLSNLTALGIFSKKIDELCFYLMRQS
jgi:CubicO group peptidase (beta-lactamase class C family)